jgi:hypothetical protein
MDQLTLFNKMADVSNNYLREYFHINILDLIYELEDQALNLVDTEFEKLYGRRKRKTLDPGVTSYIREARIGALEDSGSRHNRGRSRDSRTGYSGESRYSTTATRDSQSETGRSRSRTRN